MILHVVGSIAGAPVQRNGRTFHGYRAICGASIVALGPLAEKATIAIGVEPHAHCPKCFAALGDEEHNEVALPDDPLAGAVYDEKGNKIAAEYGRERDGTNWDKVGRTEKMSKIQDGNGMGQYENRPYG